MHVIEVKHGDVKGGVFYVTSIEINDDYEIHTQISYDVKEALIFNNKEEAANALKLVRTDMTAKSGYSVKVRRF